MCDYGDSSQQKDWIFSPQMLEKCRKRANQEARLYLSKGEKSSFAPWFKFACGYSKNPDAQMDLDAPEMTSSGHPYISPEEEQLLISFYVAKVPSLIGPFAQNPYLRREVKVTATAALLFRRFFLSNSVMLHDPKHILVSAAFMATKVEDCLTQAHHLEEGTKLMNSHVTKDEILKAEFPLLGGIDCDLLCFHSYKVVLAFTEDLRTFLKTKEGRTLATFANGEDRPIVGQDLSPMHNEARKLVDDVVVSDIPLLYSPGQIGLAALMVRHNLWHDCAHEECSRLNFFVCFQLANENINKPDVPKIDFQGYVHFRFKGQNHASVTSNVKTLCEMLKGLKEGKYGCGNHKVDLVKLKAVHKKLKKCRASEKKKKKRKAASTEDDENESKKQKRDE